MARMVRAVFKLDDGVLQKASQVAPRVMAKAQDDAADFIIRRVNNGPKPAPKRTGRLRGSYKKKRSHRGLRILVLSDPADFRADQVTYYAGFVERGTRYMSARPHFRPAVRAARRRLRRVARKMLNDEFRGLK